MNAPHPLLRVPVPVRIIALVVAAILIPSVLITALGLFAIFRAEPMVREQLAYPVQEALDRLRDRLASDWEHRFQDLERRAAAGTLTAGAPGVARPHVSDVIVYEGGGFKRLRPAGDAPAFEASPADPVLARARELEFHKRDPRAALAAYRAAVPAASPETTVEALLGAARCHRELGDWQEAVRLLRRVAEVYGDTVDLTGMARSLPALLSVVEISRENGDLLAEGLAARELLAELDRRSGSLDAETRAIFLARLKRPAERAGGLPAAAPEAAGPSSHLEAAAAEAPPGAEELLEKLRPHAEERAALEAPAYHRLALSGGEGAVLAFFRSPGGGLVYARLDPAAYLAEVRLFCRELNLREEALRFSDTSGGPAGPADAAAGSRATGPRPLASRALPRPLGHVEVQYHAAPGEVTDDLRRLETSRVALLTWSIIVLVLMIMLGVSLTLRSVLREMRVTRLKSDFVSFVTHELKTPLTAIRMFTETLLLGRVPDEEERRRCVELIDQEAARLSRLIEQILEFSKIERRQKSFKLASADMAEVVDEAVRIFLEHNREVGCEVEVNKAQDRISRIKMDRAAMVELFLNLLSNALKYSRDSKKIVVNVRESINDISVEVIDRGIGIPKREQRKIFEQFYRAEDYLTREVEGTGLGLTFARYIAKVHGGDIKVSSALNQGSTFTLELRKNQVLAE